MLGIDVSKKTLTVTLLDPHSRETRWQTTVSNDQAGIAQLLARPPRDTPRWLEPTGRPRPAAVDTPRAPAPSRIPLVLGLLHAMGSAGQWRELGLPSGDIPIALFSFHIGIERGQRVFVLALLAFSPLVRRLPIPNPSRIAIYVMGCLAAFWMIERSLAIF